MRPFFLAALMALLIGVPAADAAAHDGWFVRVCPAKTEANRFHLVFSGGRQGFSWVLDQRSTFPGGFTPWCASRCAAVQPQHRTTSNLTPMSVSGFAIITLRAWDSTTMKITKRIGMTPTIVLAKSRANR